MIVELPITVKYVAEISPLVDVWLVGAADLSFWKERLSGLGLVPAEYAGQARVVISAMEAKYMGVRFRELCVSISAGTKEEEARRDAFYLAQGFHSSRLFGWFERTLFSTPYEYAKIRVAAALRASIELSQNNEVVFRAEMSDEHLAAARAAVQSSHEKWEGPIFLPKRGPDNSPGKMFYARFEGQTRRYPFTAADRVVVKPSPSPPALQWLVDSSFAGKEWVIRENATHARSKTLVRG